MTQPDPFAPSADEPQTAPPQAPATPDDPWSAPPQGFATPEPPAQAPAVKTVAPSEDGKVVLTFKGGTGYDAPWIVIHATSLEDAHDQVTGENANLLAKVMTQTQNAGSHFSRLGGGKPTGGGNSGGGSNAPQAAQQAPNGEKQYCQHGEMEYKTGISQKSGKHYALFSCTAPRDEQCKAKFPSK
ncbi:hypothetical protein BKG67_23130 [Mycobacteroides chelonae]|nr:hypothetical protein BKG66_24595 [Mycobacteroides chelonae]OHT69451.1 hypothetical protein BKG67_23130 [Mycobacteroides chelonae]